MIENTINLTIYRKTDISLVQEALKKQDIQFPVFIREYQNCYRIHFISDYEEWGLETLFLESFPDWEFTSCPGNGKKEIRISFHRYQCRLSADSWGRPLENPLDEVKYLIKKKNLEPLKYNPEVQVLFGYSEEFFKVEIVPGKNKHTGEVGYLVLNNLENEENELKFLKNQLFENPHKAFMEGLNEIERIADKKLHKYFKRKRIKE